MGMVNAFSDSADFSGLLETKEALSISEVIQKNFINVTEDGTEAASATAGKPKTSAFFYESNQIFKILPN